MSLRLAGRSVVDGLSSAASLHSIADALYKAAGIIDNFTASDFYTCRLLINNGLVLGTGMGAELNGSAVVNRSENCTTTGATVVEAATYTIDFDVVAVAPSTFLTAASVWALWVPLDGTGAIPTP